MPFIWVFSAMYVAGAGLLWFSAPDDFNVWFVMLAFGVGLIGMEFATVFTNAMLPGLGAREEIGRISGSGWAFGYAGGVIALAIMLLLFAETATGRTLMGIEPVLGLDPAAREGTRAVGPFTALWFAVFMIPFFLWVKEPAVPGAPGVATALGGALPDLWRTIRRLPARPSLLSYLGSSMLYRDALNGMFTFGGIYAVGVLGWSPTDVGVFGILAALTGAVFAWLGGGADSRFGPKPVIVANVALLAAVAVAVVFVSRQSVFGVPVGTESRAPDIAFYVLGALIGAGAGALQSASRTMMVRQSDPARMTEAFALYALSGKATAFLAPLAIAVTTDVTGSQQFGIVPLIVMFAAGLILLLWVKSEGEGQT
jgi:UMF1 family MFS transporter